MSVPRPGMRTLGTVVASAIAATAVFAASGGARTAAGPTNNALPVVSGSAQVGSALDSSSGSWSGTSITYAYQWQRCDSAGANCVNIAGANSSTYAVVVADVGHKLRSHVTATDAGGSTTADSNPTAVVTGSAAPTNTAAPTVSGTAAQGYALTAATGTWTGSGITYTYQWRRCDASGAACVDISGQTAKTYLTTSSDVSHTLRVLVTATNAGGSGQALSAHTATVVVPAPGNTTAPAVTGNPTQGQTLTVSNGEWIGGTPITYTYAWSRCDSSGNNCAAISGATSATYVLTATDVGHDVRAVVTAKNSVGTTAANSNAAGPVVASGPVLPTGAVKLPNGETSVPASSVPDTDRLAVSSVSFSPAAIHRRAPVTVTFKIQDANKYDVAGALVYVLALPYGWARSGAEAATGQDGTVTITVTPTAKAPKRGALVLFVRARTPSGSLLAGSSTRRLVQVSMKP